MKALIFAALLLFAAPSEDVTYTAQSVNVSQPGTPLKINVLRWSTEDELRPMITALAAPAAQPSEIARANAAAAGRGRGAAGRGRGRGGAAAPLSPIDAFAAALRRAPTVGYIWTNDITGYSIKYAWRMAMTDGTERVILASDRRLGAYEAAWKPTAPATETDYVFTLLELRVRSKGVIEGKASLTSTIAVDSAAKIIGLENYNSAPTLLQGTTR